MTLLHDAIENKKYDVRLIERNLIRGVIVQPDVDKFNSRLPDDSENAEWVSLKTLVEEDSSSKNNSSS